MSQIEARDSTLFSLIERSRQEAASVRDFPAGAGVDPELGNLIQIAASAINIIARDPRTRSTPELKPVLSSATIALRRAGVIVRKAIPGIERAEAEVRGGHAVSHRCRACPLRSCASRFPGPDDFS